MRDRVSTTYLASIACLRVEAKQPHHAIATPRANEARGSTEVNRRPSPRAEGIYPAGPLLGSQTEILVHCYVDAVYVSCIFNNLTGKNTSNR